MSKKLNGNEMYESSRFIIPQHREAALRQAREISRREKPLLDEQEIHRIERVLIDSYNRRTFITITLFDPFDDVQMKGLVIVINTYLREIKLWFEDEYNWIKMIDIIAAEV
ncbi:YolD-like family protein [Paenibacillus glacialis]|uniref:YolD-like family protein n=1 Tax=Paenibacillus glacialis TaxID=494026 RepID=A0A168D497_9BACL|nr:YolD-like family protein [Paenibacillus glacialis]OAB33855.1 hypothetical protein PGLA_23310 [Paenibacillus glacialis]